MSRLALSSAQIQAALDAQVWQHEGTELRRSEAGLGLFAARDYRAGEVIYRAELFVLGAGIQGLQARVEIDGGVHVVPLSIEHTVHFNGVVWLDVPGCFINHSCAPNTHSVFHQASALAVPDSYEQFTLVDVQRGQEFTCDYTRFDWGDDGYAFECECGSENCHGLIDGFGGLSAEEQRRTQHTATLEAARMWHLAMSMAPTPRD